MKPLVSINCTTYNHGDYIEETLNSFLMQKTSFDFEILIHDDASTDNTSEIIDKYSKIYPDIIKPIIQTKNQFSQGIKKINYKFNHSRAKGKYVAICEGDDYWTDPYKLQNQVDYLENHPECTLCFHSANIINSRDEVKALIRPYNSSQIVPMTDLIVMGGGFCATSSIIYRKTAMDNAPDFYFEAPVGDYPIQLISSHKGYAYYIDKNMSIYRKIVKSGSSWSSKNKSIESQIKLFSEIGKMLTEFNIYSSFKYNDAIIRTIEFDEFYNVINRKQYKKFFKKDNLTIYSNLPLRNKILVIIRLISPTFYLKMLDHKYK